MNTTIPGYGKVHALELADQQFQKTGVTNEEVFTSINDPGDEQPGVGVESTSVR